MSAILAKIASVVGLVFPFFAKAAKHRTTWSALRWILHVIIIAAILVGLFFLNKYLGLEGIVKSDIGVLRNGFLPILFLLAYVLGWLGWWLWKLLLPGDDESAFPDIDQAWDRIIEALGKSGIGLGDAPLFLVIGRPARSEEALFQASAIPLDIKGQPGREAPVRVYANRDGIYITCAATCLLGRQAVLLSGEAPETPSGHVSSSGGDPMLESVSLMTLRPGEGSKGIQEIQAVLERARRQGRGPNDLTQDEKDEIARLEKKDKPRRTALLNTEEARTIAARFEHVCRLIVRDRRPYCPVNGILVLLPFAGAEGDEEATQTGDAARSDLATARRIFQVHCPSLALVCDLEMARGFGEFASHFSEKQRQQRLGQRFPHVPDARPENLPQVIDDMSGWVCHAVFPNWVYKYFRIEAPQKDNLATAVQKNRRLFQFLEELRSRKTRLSRILTRALLLDASGPLLFGGCYFGATGPDASREQAFVAGVFARLAKEQGILCWTDEAQAEDEAAARWTTMGYAALGILVVGVIAAVAALFFLGGKH
jgi:hypothetical protein